eukprot:Polyplicarium_translucidae@DN2203_c0_g1_i1.p1
MHVADEIGLLRPIDDTGGLLSHAEGVTPSQLGAALERRDYHAALRASKLLAARSADRRAFDPEAFAAWTTIKLVCLMKLGQGETAFDECAALGDLDGARFRRESYPEVWGNDARGCFAPFALRLVCACVPFFANPELTLGFERCHTLLRRLQAEEAPQGPRLRQVAHVLADAYAIRGQYTDALEVLEIEVLKSWPDDGPTVSKMGRLCVAMGALTAAQMHFARAEELGASQSMIRFNRALTSAGLGDSGRAKALFEAAQAVCPSRAGGPPSMAGEYPRGASVCANNAAVSSIIAGVAIETAISTLEAATLGDPATNCFPVAVRNLATLHELRPSRAEKLQGLRGTVLRVEGQDRECRGVDDEDVVSSILSPFR